MVIESESKYGMLATDLFRRSEAKDEDDDEAFSRLLRRMSMHMMERVALSMMNEASSCVASWWS